MNIVRDIIERVVLSWKTLILLTLLGLVLVGVESCAGLERQRMTVVAKDVPCMATSINNDGEVKVKCGGSQDSFTDSKIAISLLQKPQPLTCTLHKAKDHADCSLPTKKKS